MRFLAVLLLAGAGLTLVPGHAQAACTYDYAHVDDAGASATCPVPVAGTCTARVLAPWYPAPYARCGDATTQIPPMCGVHPPSPDLDPETGMTCTSEPAPVGPACEAGWRLGTGAEVDC